jgi:hypothetical protein
MKYIKLFEDFKVEDIPQDDLNFVQWLLNNSPKAVLKPQDWFEGEWTKSNPDWEFIFYVTKKLGLADSLKVPKEELKGSNWSKDWIESFTLLNWASKYNLQELAKGLIDAGADVNKHDLFRDTPLHHAIWWNHPEIVEILIKSGADINMQNFYEYTPLHHAILKNRSELAKGLIDAGANLNLKDYKGRIPWDLANPQIREALPELNPNGESL